jgi:hypothetical protein
VRPADGGETQVAGEGRSAEQFRPVAEFPRDDPHRVGDDGNGVPVDGLPDSGQHVLAGRAERSVDDHRGRVEQGAEAGQRLADQPAEVREYPADGRLALGDKRENLREREPLLVGTLREVQQRQAHDLRQAAAAAADAHGAVGAHPHMREFAREPGRAAVQPAADDQPRSHVVPELEVDEAVMASARAVGRLAERGQIRVILDPDRNAQALRHRRRGLAKADRPRQPDHDSVQLPGREALGVEHRLHQVAARPGDRVDIPGLAAGDLLDR